MYKKYIFTFLLLSSFQTKPVLGEIVLGAALAKIISSPAVKYARLIALGYVLNTSAGKKTLSYGSDVASRFLSKNKFQDVVSQNSFLDVAKKIGLKSVATIQSASQIVSKKITPSCSLQGASSCAPASRVELINVKDGVAASKNASTKPSLVSRMFKPFGGEQRNSSSASFNNFAQQAAQSESLNKPGQYTAQQASGLFPKINNHYYQGEASDSKFWKGFSAGTFGSWSLATWMYTKKDRENQTIKAESVKN